MHAAAEDAGRYTCIVSNSAGEERKTFDLDILGEKIENLLYRVLFCFVCLFLFLALCHNIV